MSRFFATITEEEVKKKVFAILGDREDDEDPRICPYKISNNKVLSKDMKVEFDFENFECEPQNWAKNRLFGLQTLDNGMVCWGMYGGGDWEHGVTFILYWDGKSVRAYVPKDGNMWNTKTNKAYGNDEELDAENMEKEGRHDYNDLMMIADIKARILPKPNATPVTAGISCPVCKITNIAPHPLEPSLRIAQADGHLVVVGDHYTEGTLGFYIPVGATVPEKILEDMWLVGKLSGKKKNKVKAREIRGIKSEGLFYGSSYFLYDDQLPSGKRYIYSRNWNPVWEIGNDVAKELGIT